MQIADTPRVVRQSEERLHQPAGLRSASGGLASQHILACPNSHLALLAREPSAGSRVLLIGCSRRASGALGPVLLAGGRPGVFREWVLTKAGTSRLAQWQSTRPILWESQVRILYRRGVKPAPEIGRAHV